MRAAIFYSPRDIRIEEAPAPVPAADEVVIGVEAAGICGSDLHCYRGTSIWSSDLTFPDRRGHELAGVVVELGSDVARLRVGQRVAVEPSHLRGCGRCAQCLRGDYHICAARARGVVARARSAGFSELDLAPAVNVFPLPDHLSFEAGALLDVYACGIHAVNRVPVRGAAVAIIGTGPVALTLGQVARATGAATTVVVGLRDEALAVALEVGAADQVINSAAVDDLGAAVRELTSGEGAGVVFETVGGEGQTMAQAVAAAAYGGAIGIMGCFPGKLSVAYREAASKELSLRLSNGYSTWRGAREYQVALDMVAGGRVRADPLITHRFPLEEIARGFAAAADKKSSGAIKVVVQPRGSSAGE